MSLRPKTQKIREVPINSETRKVWKLGGWAKRMNLFSTIPRPANHLWILRLDSVLLVKRREFRV